MKLRIGWSTLWLLWLIVLWWIVVGCSDNATESGAGQRDAGQSTTSSSAQPVKEASGVGRVDTYGGDVDPDALQLITAVYEAAQAHDHETLLELCDSCSDPAVAREQRRILTRPDKLDELVLVLQTHPETTDGYTYPGFVMAGFQSDYDFADAKALGVKAPAGGVGPPPSDYRGIRTSFESPFVTGGKDWTWGGVYEGG